jgi:hypothetical protein
LGLPGWFGRGDTATVLAAPFAATSEVALAGSGSYPPPAAPLHHPPTAGVTPCLLVDDQDLAATFAEAFSRTRPTAGSGD